MTPTTPRQLSLPYSRTRLPNGFCPGQYLRANASFTIATGWDPVRSAAVKIRPDFSRAPSAAK